MPVPVPCFSKPVAHPVIKLNRPGSQEYPRSSVFQNLTHTLPVSPTGPPPSFGTREEWINSLPSWRRAKPRQSWDDDGSNVQERNHNDQHFQQGLTLAANATAIKGPRAQAWIPPFCTFSEDISISQAPYTAATATDMPNDFDGDADDEMSSESSSLDPTTVDDISSWIATSPISNPDLEDSSPPQVAPVSPTFTHDAALNQDLYERGAFSPVFEDQSPESVGRLGSSPLGPVTPFGEFVDRAVTDIAYAYPTVEQYAGNHDICQDNGCDPQCYQQQHHSLELPKEPAPPEPVITPSATAAYKRLADPLSEWVANYVWKVCTTGMSLPPAFTRSAPFALQRSFPTAPPGHLAAALHSLLLSTLLQPSALFLAVWYIVRLPVYLGDAELGVAQVKELAFRQELLGDTSLGVDADLNQSSAPFRLIVLGCMLANKWLDDHTFSNKTWHTISNIPICSLNNLEFLALDIFHYNLSVPTQSWIQWLAHIQAYHMSLSSPARTQPISRPSANPHSIVRKTIDELVDSPTVLESCGEETCKDFIPEPVFLGLEERRAERLEREQANQIDLDEDGPLREEYLPRRRISATGSVRSVRSRDSSNQRPDVDTRPSARLFRPERVLPPPAKWSPAGDEPILRERNRSSGQYVAVQPPVAVAVPIAPLNDYIFPSWTAPGGLLSAKPLDPVSGFDALSHRAIPPLHGGYAALAPHSRSYDQENVHPGALGQTCVQPRCGYKYSDMRSFFNDSHLFSHVDGHWADHHAYDAHKIHPFGPHPGINYLTNGLRT